MRIVDRKSTLVPFEDISCGEIFKDHNGLYCMKIEKCVTENCGFYINYIYLADGEIGWATDSSEYEKVDCELVVK